MPSQKTPSTILRSLWLPPVIALLFAMTTGCSISPQPDTKDALEATPSAGSSAAPTTSPSTSQDQLGTHSSKLLVFCTPVQIGNTKCDGSNMLKCKAVFGSYQWVEIKTCTYGCYKTDVNAYCKCEGGRVNGESWCGETNELKTCIFSRQVDGASTSSACNHGCNMVNNEGYCKCSGNYASHATFCGAGNTIRICALSKEPGGETQAQVVCNYGCSTSNNQPSCKCEGNRQVGASWCDVASSTIRTCTQSNQADGTYDARACEHGCYTSGNLTQCKCEGGHVTGTSFCDGNTRKSCVQNVFSINPSLVVGNTCEYGCSVVDSQAYCDCNTLKAGKSVCNSSVQQPRVRSCGLTTLTSPSTSISNVCTYRCFENGAGTRASCKCSFGAPGARACYGNGIKTCQYSTSSSGSYTSYSCGTTCGFGGCYNMTCSTNSSGQPFCH